MRRGAGIGIPVISAIAVAKSGSFTSPKIPKLL